MDRSVLVDRSHEFAWAAGLFEGEGSIYAPNDHGVRGRIIALQLQMKDEDVVRRFHSIVKVGSVNAWQPKDRDYPMWKWKACARYDVESFLEVVWPWLGARRRAKAIQLLEHRDASFVEKPYQRQGLD